MPPTIFLDSFETCLSLEALRPELEALGLTSEDLELWQATAMRDAFAREIVGAFRPYKDVLRIALVRLLLARGTPFDGDTEIIERFAELPAHADVRPALEMARARGARVAVVTNFDEDSTHEAFARAGLGELVEMYFSSEDVGHYKPAPQLYLHAADMLGVELADCVLIAAHAWDMRGARNAGLRAAFVQRVDPLPEELRPDVVTVARSMERVVQAVLDLRPPLEMAAMP